MIELLGFSFICLVLLVVGCLSYFIYKVFFYNGNTFDDNDPRLTKVPSTPDGRFVCEKDKRRLDGYCPKSKKFYFFRKGEELPEHLLLIRVPDNLILCLCHRYQKEGKAQMRIDVVNHGYNALIDYTVSSQGSYPVTILRGRPALIVSRNYTGDINLLLDRCEDNWDETLYSEVIKNEDP